MFQPGSLGPAYYSERASFAASAPRADRLDPEVPMPGYIRAAERREQLLSAARAVLVREGLDELTLRDVAAEADVRLSTLQYIFASRAELVRALAASVVANAGRKEFATGSAGLAVELHRAVHWYATDFLADQAILELVRFEVLTAARHRSREGASRLPEDWPRMTILIPARLEQICAQADEEYDVSVADLTRLWTPGLIGLIHQLLADADFERFHRDADFLVDHLVTLAAPRPRR
jgi:AcrR family transcriptional regulator